jgi:branched-chain amino acid transport system ATP-binding protein
MLAVGRALMAKPKLLMLDEPSLGLAPLIVKEIFRIISDLKSTGCLDSFGRAECSGGFKGC